MSSDNEVFELRRNKVRMSKKEKIQQKKLQEINFHLEQAKDSIKAAMKIADQYGLSFCWSPPAMSHGEGSGMGGYYYGKGHEYRNEDYDGWSPSSVGC